MDDLGKFARRERNTSTARECFSAAWRSRPRSEFAPIVAFVLILVTNAVFWAHSEREGEVKQVLLRPPRHYLSRKAPRIDEITGFRLVAVISPINAFPDEISQSNLAGKARKPLGWSAVGNENAS